ncbi:hypothetical protein [Halorientalis salina]|nr:hypothetical protein [Halorientalis salina]
MATESSDAEVETDGTVERPAFRGCVFCYGAEMTYYGARKLSSRLTSKSE